MLPASSGLRSNQALTEESLHCLWCQKSLFSTSISKELLLVSTKYILPHPSFFLVSAKFKQNSFFIFLSELRSTYYYIWSYVNWFGPKHIMSWIYIFRGLRLIRVILMYYYVLLIPSIRDWTIQDLYSEVSIKMGFLANVSRPWLKRTWFKISFWWQERERSSRKKH